MKKRIYLIHLLFVLILILSACGGSREAVIEHSLEVEGPIREAIPQAKPDQGQQPTSERIADDANNMVEEGRENAGESSENEEIALQDDNRIETTSRQTGLSDQEIEEIIANGQPLADSKLVRIAVQSPLSGAFAHFGIGIKNGAILAVDQMSAPLQEQGYTIELMPFDDQSIAPLGIANAKQIVADPAVLCMIGHLNDDVMLSTMDIYHTAGLATLSPANAHPIITDRRYPETNRLIGRDDQQGMAVEAFLREKFDISTLYIMHDKSAYGQSVAEAVRQAAEESGISLLGFDGIEEADFGALVTMIPFSKPDAIFYGAAYKKAATFFSLAREEGVTSIMISPTTIRSEVGVLDQLPVDTYYSTLIAPADIYPNTGPYIEAYKARFGEEPAPFSAQAYDSVSLCLQAVEMALIDNGGQQPTRSMVVENIRKIVDYEGLTGRITLDENGDRTLAPYFISQVISPDPAQWSQNKIIYTISLPPHRSNGLGNE